MNIEIEWLSDSNDCETCGGGWANGARVTFDGYPAIDMTPIASCYDSPADYSEEDVYRAIFEKLGHTLTSRAEL